MSDNIANKANANNDNIMPEIIEKAREKFFQMIDEFGSDPYRLSGHVPEVEKWARWILKDYPEAEEEVTILGACLHDLGHYPIPTETDHAIRGEERARAFLESESYPKDKMDKVLHCIRAHRCRDAMPESLEAKIVACADSASHMMSWTYFDMAIDDKRDKCEFRAYGKIERDFRDLAAFPQVQEKLRGLYDAWKNVINEYEKIDIE
jgi:hypothetical protein